jgi:lipid-A-disaccharide synthase
VAFLIAAPDEEVREQLRRMLAELPPGPARWDVVAGVTREVLRQADAAIVASGTATLEASLMLCPMVIVYRVSALTYFIARRLVRVPHIGIVNIVAGREICPEFIQDAVEPAALARAMEPLLRDDGRRHAVRADLQQVNQALGSGGAAARAAALVIDELRA